jgi:poly-gamma-glutamate capsule biosynthesis protein CapA/YwtB (metallophosphatase superfamily)
MGTANNHTMDFGAEGLASTMASLDRAGIVHAGAGRDLVEAARPAFLETATGRVALVNCASSFFDGFAAGPPHPIHKGRPGLNPLHLRHIVQVERSLFQRLDKAQKVICDLLGWSEAGNGLAVVAGEWPAGTALFFETLIQAGKSVDVLYEPWPADLSRILEAIQTARREARVVIASLHTHEVRRKVEAPSPFLPGVAHACLDAGADVFLATGPHVARGVEIYRGKPIFYSLGNFLVHFEALAMDAGPPTREPGNREGAALHQQRRFWQSFVPCLTFVEDGQIAAIELHPITLASVPPFGTPRLARGEEARVILTRLVELSRPFGTEIDLGGEVGRIRLN